MNINMPYLNDKDFLKDLDEMNVKELFASIIILDQEENAIKTIQGQTSNGQLNIDGQSSVRRAGNLTFIPNNNETHLMDAKNLISINKRIKIDIGYTNNLIKKYPLYAQYNIIWFPLGVFIITDVSFSQAIDGGYSISISFQDKMSLLNGTVGGVLPAALTLSTYIQSNTINCTVNVDTNTFTTVSNHNWQNGTQVYLDCTDAFPILSNLDSMDSNTPYYIINKTDTSFQLSETINGNSIILKSISNGILSVSDNTEIDATIYQIIQNLIHSYGGERLDNIIIKDIDNYATQLEKWNPDNGTDLLYLYKGINEYEYYLSNSNQESGMGTLTSTIYEPLTPIGYEETLFTYPGTESLTADAGQTICDILDIIKNKLGNYEYFYNVQGQFVFQEIKNYLNTSFSTELVSELENNPYSKVLGRTESVYDFTNNNLISSLTNSENYVDIKNDFIVWGKKTDSTGATNAIRYHLAIDTKPQPQKQISGIKEDWRNVLYREGKNANATYGMESNYYALELLSEWNYLYNPDTLTWKVNKLNEINYFLDFIDTSSKITQLNVNNIGRRTKVIIDDDVNCLFAPIIEDRIIINNEAPDKTDQITRAINKGTEYALVTDNIYKQITQSPDYKDAFSVVRNLLYSSTSYNTTILLQTIPIYHLDSNNRITVYDTKSGIHGDHLINSISVPLSISDTMSISATAVIERI